MAFVRQRVAAAVAIRGERPSPLRREHIATIGKWPGRPPGTSWTHPSSRTMMCATTIVGAVMDIVVWLRSLGLGKYEAAFRENEIDETVLPSLTHETLKELGVSAVGHRLKLLDAIAALGNVQGAKAPSAARRYPE